MNVGVRVRRRVVLLGALALGLAACGGGAEVRGPALLFFYTDG
jgi:ABC-type glycerol-3-phosphate transport system substrate-binding protein